MLSYSRGDEDSANSGHEHDPSFPTAHASFELEILSKRALTHNTGDVNSKVTIAFFNVSNGVDEFHPKVNFFLLTVTFRANPAHQLTCFP